MSISEVRNAAESLLAPVPNYSSNSGLLDDINAAHQLEQQLSSTCNSLSSLEEFSSGARRNGQMSAVRRFFCLFVLFDLLLISLTWLICMMLLGGNNLVEILKMQVLHYNLASSLFDVVLAAFCRFTVLLLFYGLLQLNTTFFVALTTLGTSVFLIFKVVYYSWSTASQPAFQVILILISFVIAWSEAWFLDFRVLPQELFALNYAQLSSGRFSESINTLLLNRNLRGPVLRHFLRDVGSDMGQTESCGNYYSPLASPNDSDDEDNNQKNQRERATGHAIERSLVSHVLNIKAIQSSLNTGDFSRRGKATLEVAWNILNGGHWKLQKESEDGDRVFSKQEPDLGKVFLLKAEINISPRKLLDELFLHVENFPTWNKTILVSEKIETVDDHTDVTYQVSAPGGNGLISSRDFVNLRHWDLKGNVFVLAGISILHAKVPPRSPHVRGKNGPCCWVMIPHGENMESCNFEFLLSTDLRGWIPQYVLDSALTSVLLEYSSCLKEYCKTLNKLGVTCRS